jgi:hypothetical protein
VDAPVVKGGRFALPLIPGDAGNNEADLTQSRRGKKFEGQNYASSVQLSAEPVWLTADG